MSDDRKAEIRERLEKATPGINEVLANPSRYSGRSWDEANAMKVVTDDIAFLTEENEKLREALKESVRLQSHYAGLLNSWDGGQRLQFEDEEAWLKRLADLRARRVLEGVSNG